MKEIWLERETRLELEMLEGKYQGVLGVEKGEGFLISVGSPTGVRKERESLYLVSIVAEENPSLFRAVHALQFESMCP